MALSSILSSSTRSLKRSSSTPKDEPVRRTVNAEQVKPLGRVALLDKPLSVFLDPIVNESRPVRGRDYNLLIVAIVTKFPHLTFRDKVYSSVQKRVKFLFFNSVDKVTCSYTYKEAQDLLHRAVTGRPFVSNEETERTEREQFVPVHIPLSRYQQHLLNKYGTIQPFKPVPLPTGFNDLDFEYKDENSFAGLKQSKRFSYEKGKK